MTPLVISHSKRKKYETCPKQFFHTAVVQDVVEQSNDAAVWGNVVHEALEHRLRDGTPLPGCAARRRVSHRTRRPR